MKRIANFFRSLTAFNQSFWSANISELFERIAFYGMTTMLVIYLTQVRGVSAAAATDLNGYFTFLVYFLPVFSGVIADWMGYRRAFMLAYGLLGVGYLLTGQFTTYWSIAGALLLVAFGASIVKPTVTGTVQKTSLTAQAAVGFSIYYMLVNVGGFLGPNLSGFVSDTLGLGPQRIFYSSTAAIVVAFLLILFMFKEPGLKPGETPAEKKSFGGFLKDFFTVLGNGQMMLLFLWVTLYWSVFFQFYNAMPLYFTQDLGTSDSTYAFVVSLDALAIVCLQVVVGYLVRNLPTLKAVMLGILVSSIGVCAMALYAAPWMVGVGIFIFAVGEMTYAAHFYKYMGELAPKDQVGMYMGFAFLPIALGGLVAGKAAVPVADFARETLGSAQLMWLVFGAAGLVAVVGIAFQAMIFKPRSGEPDGGETVSA